MADDTTTGRPELRVGVAMTTEPEPRRRRVAATGEPFKILFVGDFSGRAGRGDGAAEALATRRPRRIDRDDFDDVFAALAPRLQLHLGAAGAPLEVAFGELDDLEPDALYSRVGLFARLRALRERLLAPATAADAIAEMTGAIAAPDVGAAAEPAAPAAAGGSVLESALRETEARPGDTAARPELVEQLIRDYVLPYAIPRPDPRVDDLVADVDRAAAEQMRALLGAPEFRRLEANWRSLHLLVRRLETSPRLQLWLLDAGVEELRADLGGVDDALLSGLARLLIDREVGTEGGVGYGLVIGDLVLAPELADVGLAGRVAAVCARAGAPFVCAAAPAWAGCASFADAADPDDWTGAIDGAVAAAWRELRGRPEAAALGAVMPRYLVRRPYGPRSSPVRCFAFEEDRDGARHEDLPWGSAAPLVALLVARSWQRAGWGMRGLVDDEVGDLATHVRHDAGQAEAVPCAEIELSSRGAERIGALGFMPLLSVRGKDAVRLGALRSVAADGRGLAGRWGAP